MTFNEWNFFSTFFFRGLDLYLFIFKLRFFTFWWCVNIYLRQWKKNSRYNNTIYRLLSSSIKLQHRQKNVFLFANFSLFFFCFCFSFISFFTLCCYFCCYFCFNSYNYLHAFIKAEILKHKNEIDFKECFQFHIWFC